jgi:uroporphyrinogen III methyltransferase/synthase
VTVYLVGAGPGDPRLITWRGLDIVRRAEVLVYDRLAPDALLDEVPAGCVLVEAGKRPGAPTMTQDEINAALVEHGRTGQTVVRLKGGDPFVFGRGGEEARALHAAGVPYEVVPGVTSAIAVPSAAGIPVTQRGLAAQFAVVTGHEEPGKEESDLDWAALAAFPGTLVFLMGVSRLSSIADALMQAGKDPTTPCAVVASGTTARQRTVRAGLAHLAAVVAAEQVAAPAVTVVGPVAALAGELAWAEQRPLHGRRIVVTRARTQASALSGRLRELGAEVLEVPTIRIEPLDGPPLELEAIDVVCVTSPNTPRLLLDRLGGDARVLAGRTVAAVGPGTAAALREIGIAPDVVAPRSIGEGVVEALGDRVAGRRVLVAQAEDARDAVPEGLRAAGADVTVAPLYRTVAEHPRSPERALGADAVAFTASSSVRNFAAVLAGHDLSGVAAVSIGPETTRTAREVGLNVVAEADPHDLDGLVDALVRHLREP